MLFPSFKYKIMPRPKQDRKISKSSIDARICFFLAFHEENAEFSYIAV